MTRYKAIFLDIDDTLLDYIPCCRQAFDYAMECIHEESTDQLFDLFMAISGRLFDEAKQGLHTIAEVMELYPAEFISRAQIREELLETFKHSFREGWGRGHVLTAGALEVVSRLHELGYRLFAASNSFAHLQRQRLTLAGLMPYLEDTYVSSDIGYDKPDVRFYEEALRRAGLQPNEVLMVGDSMTTDVLGAQAAGLDACYINLHAYTHPHHPQYEVRSLNELLQYL